MYYANWSSLKRIVNLNFTMSLIPCLGLTLLLSLSAIAVNSAADDDGIFTYEVTGSTVSITGCVDVCPTELVIPESYNGSARYKNRLSCILAKRIG